MAKEKERCLFLTASQPRKNKCHARSVFVIGNTVWFKALKMDLAAMRGEAEHFSCTIAEFKKIVAAFEPKKKGRYPLPSRVGELRGKRAQK